MAERTPSPTNNEEDDNAAGLEAFHRFRLEVLADPQIQAQLHPVNETAPFIEAVVRLGTERGYRFDAETVRTAMQQAAMAWQLRRVL